MRILKWAHTPSQNQRLLISEPRREARFRVFRGFIWGKYGEKLKIFALKMYLLLEKWPKMAINKLVASFQVYFSSELSDFENFDFLTHFGCSEGQKMPIFAKF